jgi:23S rRNA (cytidine1920-2'-O)/16S rRNA (cytidine1409-2'-O)-methyltransferase
MEEVRLDTLLVQKRLVESRQKAQGLILAGQVLVDGHPVDKPGRRIPESAEVTIREGLPYVSRGGIKLEHALDRFDIDVSGKIAADIGASTGGFTDCLLQRGARKVYAIDVGYGQLAWKLRQDPRVVVLERTNIRYLETLPEPVDIATIDVSFISLALVLPQVERLLRPQGEIVSLIKPQFEAGRDQVGKGGVVREPGIHRAVLEKVIGLAEREGLRIRGLTPAPVRGPAGNVEFFIHLSRDQRLDSISIEEALDVCLSEAEGIGQRSEVQACE